MTTFTGKEGSADAGGSAVGEIRSFEINASGETLDDTVMGDTWRTRKAMHNDWSGSMSVLIDPTDAGQNAMAVGASIVGTFYPHSDGQTLGDLELTGSLIVTERNISTAYEGLVELSLSFEGNGALTEGTV